MHPSRYIKMLDGVDVIGLADVHVLHDQMAALRLVAFIDRVYDAEIPVVQTGTPLSEVFDDEMLGGGYRKKYLRSMSRMIALTAGELPRTTSSARPRGILPDARPGDSHGPETDCLHSAGMRNTRETRASCRRNLPRSDWLHPEAPDPAPMSPNPSPGRRIER